MKEMALKILWKLLLKARPERNFQAKTVYFIQNLDHYFRGYIIVTHLKKWWEFDVNLKETNIILFNYLCKNGSNLTCGEYQSYKKE